MNRTGTERFSLEAYLRAEREALEESLSEALDHLLPLFPERLRAPVHSAVTTGGKRLRPVLCVAAYEAAGRQPDGRIRSLGAALELVHAYSLMHDDLPCMDDAPLRRGHPTPHTVFGEVPTALGAAALIPAAHLHAWRVSSRMGLPEAVRREIVATLARASGGAGMVGGQALDLLGEGVELGRDELDDLHRRKTGALLTASLRIGALAAEAPSAVVRALEEYGRQIGLAFQITDDVLDATADVDVLGKNPSDAERDKSTYVRLLGVDRARQEAESLVTGAEEALHDAGIRSAALAALARYVVVRSR